MGLARLLCWLGHHDYQWTVTMTTPKLNWEECTRCGHVEEEYRGHYERFQQFADE